MGPAGLKVAHSKPPRALAQHTAVVFLFPDLLPSFESFFSFLPLILFSCWISGDVSSLTVSASSWYTEYYLPLTISTNPSLCSLYPRIRSWLQGSLRPISVGSQFLRPSVILVSTTLSIHLHTTTSPFSYFYPYSVSPENHCILLRQDVDRRREMGL